jgi:hypothetical protein
LRTQRPTGRDASHPQFAARRGSGRIDGEQSPGFLRLGAAVGRERRNTHRRVARHDKARLQRIAGAHDVGQRHAALVVRVFAVPPEDRVRLRPLGRAADRVQGEDGSRRSVVQRGPKSAADRRGPGRGRPVRGGCPGARLGRGMSRASRRERHSPDRRTDPRQTCHAADRRRGPRWRGRLGRGKPGSRGRTCRTTSNLRCPKSITITPGPQPPR